MKSESDTPQTVVLQVFLSRAKEADRLGSTCFGSIFEQTERTYAKDRIIRGVAPSFELQNTMELLLRDHVEAQVNFAIDETT